MQIGKIPVKNLRVTRTKITYDSDGVIAAGVDATTNDILDSTDKRYVTDAQRALLINTSGVNTGNQVGDGVTITGAGTAEDPFVSAGGGGLATVITDSTLTGDGSIVTPLSVSVTTADVPDSTNKRYITDAELSVVENTSNTNTGDETSNTIKTKLGVASTVSSGYLTSTGYNLFNNKQDEITSGTSTQYYRGDKTFQELNISSLSDVIVSSPVEGQRLTWNGTDWVNSSPSVVNAGSGVNFYPTITQSDLYTSTGYFYFEKSPDIVSQLDIPTTCLNNKVFIIGYISDPAIVLTVIPSGPWSMYAWGYCDKSGTGSNIVADVYQRTSTGVETLLFTMTSHALSTILQQVPSPTYVENAITFSPGDRLVYKISAQTTNMESTTVHVVGGGNTVSYVTTPYVTQHNDLDGLQGGSGTERYHLSYAKNIVMNNTSGSNTGDETKISIENLLGAASVSNSGYLTSTGYSLFNNKQDALTSSSNVSVDSIALNIIKPNVDATSAIRITKANGSTDLVTFNTSSSTGAVSIDGTLNINGNIFQNGAAYETHAEQLYTTKDLIITRDGAVSGLTIGQYTGFQAKLYDGVNDGQLVFDKDGWARVGDLGSLLKIATIEESPTDRGLTYYDLATLRLKTQTVATLNAALAHNTLSGRDTAGNHAKLIPSSDSTTAIQITKANTSTGIVIVDTTNSRVGINIQPTAQFHVKAGTITAGTAPIKLTTGAALSIIEDGSIEYHTSHLYFSIGTTRYQIDQQVAAAFESSTANIKMNGAVNVGSLSTVARADHIHASDTSRVATSRTVNAKALSSNITLGLASADFANQGTINTVLHGNASGNPAFSAITEADMTLAANTTNNVSTTKHGFTPMLPNAATQFLNGIGTWTVPSGLVSGPASSTNNNIVFFSGSTGQILIDSGLTISGSNTGDETKTSIETKLSVSSTNTAALANLTGTNTGDKTISELGGVVALSPITAGTYTKISYSSTGLVTSGYDATTADIAASTDKNYVTDAEAIIIGNTSGTNTGDQVADGVTITGNGTVGNPFVAVDSGDSSGGSITATVGQTVVAGQAVYQNSSTGLWYLAQATEGTVTNLAICKTGGLASTTVSVTRFSNLTGLTGLPNNSEVYLSQTVPGGLTSTVYTLGIVAYVGTTVGTTTLNICIGNVAYLSSPAGEVESVFGRTGDVVATTGDYTADQISDGSAYHLITTAQQTIINNTSNTNTGDETISTIESKLGLTSQQVTALANYHDGNIASQNFAIAMASALG